MEMKFKIMAVVVVVLLVLSTAAWAGTWGVLALRFERGCASHIRKAATTTSIEVAKRELDLAIGYAEQNCLTEGNSSISGKNPNCDIAFWYQNLKAVRSKLASVDVNLLEESNVLIEVRESLMSGEGTVRVPTNIECYHHQKLVNALFVIFMLNMLVCVLYFNRH